MDERWFETARRLGWGASVIGNREGTQGLTYWIRQGWKVVLVTENVIAVKHPTEYAMLSSIRFPDRRTIALANAEIAEWREKNNVAATSTSSWGDTLSKSNTPPADPSGEST